MASPTAGKRSATTPPARLHLERGHHHLPHGEHPDRGAQHLQQRTSLLPNQNGTYFNPALPSEGGGTHPLLQPVVYNTATATPTIINTSAITFPLGMPNTDAKNPPAAPTGTSLVTEDSYALYVNNSGVVVGQTDFQLWEPGYINNVISIGWLAMPGTGGTYQPAVELSSLVPASVSSAGYNRLQLAGINDQGQILTNAMAWTYGVANGQSYLGPISSARAAGSS